MVKVHPSVDVAHVSDCMDGVGTVPGVGDTYVSFGLDV